MSRFSSFWQAQNTLAAVQRSVAVASEPIHTPMAEYTTLSFPATDGQMLRARYIRPLHANKAPTLLYFHDYTCPPRGFFHMTRFLSAGYAVVAMENRANLPNIAANWEAAPQSLSYVQLYTDALTTAHVAAALPHTGSLAAFGEGLGGGLALVSAALMGRRISLLACHNPLPADIPAIVDAGANADFYASIRMHFRAEDPQHLRKGEFLAALAYVDLVNFAPLVSAQTLMGTSMMDAVTPPAAQDAVYAALACQKERLIYAKHIHERINDFEDELLAFLHRIYE